MNKLNTNILLTIVPVQPVAAVVRGGVEYGINMATIKSRVLKKTYGILLMPQFRAGIDPPERKLAHNRIQKFSKVVQRGTEIELQAYAKNNKTGEVATATFNLKF
nr:12305_t:CDS:2 [Entrophospora candida]